MRVSYREPVPTFATNALGTAHLLEAVRAANLPCTIVVVTTDKCYENDGRPRSFKESDPLGGHDPYSASKAAAEIVVASYRDSFFSHGTDVALASARAGNVVGGGDWAEDRLVPDCIRALVRGQADPGAQSRFHAALAARARAAGRLSFARRETRGSARRKNRRRKSPATRRRSISDPNPTRTAACAISSRKCCTTGPARGSRSHQEKHLKEAPLLSLAIDKARETLGWQPRWDFAETIHQTVSWYRDYFARAQKSDPPSMIDFTQKQIASYNSVGRLTVWMVFPDSILPVR